jgi:phosphatidylglycerophosphate synthase
MPEIGAGRERPGERGADAGARLALAADSLTALRAGLALALIPVLGVGRLDLGAALVGIAWISDFLDGRAARASGRATHLGSWDLAADTAVGAGILFGFTAEGWLDPLLGLGLVMVLGAAFVITRIEAMSMLLQATGYTLVLWRSWSDGLTGALIALLAVIAVIGVVNRRVLWERSIPTFLGGIAAALRGRRAG